MNKKITKVQKKCTRKVAPLRILLVKGTRKSISTSYGIAQMCGKLKSLVMQNMNGKMNKKSITS